MEERRGVEERREWRRGVEWSRGGREWRSEGWRKEGVEVRGRDKVRRGEGGDLKR